MPVCGLTWVREKTAIDAAAMYQPCGCETCFHGVPPRITQRCRRSEESGVDSRQFPPGCLVLPFPSAPHVSLMGEFEDIYGKYAGAVFRYALDVCGRRDVAEDITSEVFLTLYRNMADVDVSQLPAWLFAVAKNKAADYWRRTDSSSDISRAAFERNGLGTVPRAMAPRHEGLKAVHRACLILRYVHGMARDEIAQRLGFSDNQVKGHLQYALTILRREAGEGTLMTRSRGPCGPIPSRTTPRWRCSSSSPRRRPVHLQSTSRRLAWSCCLPERRKRSCVTSRVARYAARLARRSTIHRWVCWARMTRSDCVGVCAAKSLERTAPLAPEPPGDGRQSPRLSWRSR